MNVAIKILSSLVLKFCCILIRYRRCIIISRIVMLRTAETVFSCYRNDHFAFIDEKTSSSKLHFYSYLIFEDSEN